MLSTLAFYKKKVTIAEWLESWSHEFKTVCGLCMYLIKTSTACATSQRPVLKELSQGQKWLHVFSDSKAYDEQMDPIPCSNGNLAIALSIALTWSPHRHTFQMLLTQNLPRDRKLERSSQLIQRALVSILSNDWDSDPLPFYQGNRQPSKVLLIISVFSNITLNFEIYLMLWECKDHKVITSVRN